MIYKKGDIIAVACENSKHRLGLILQADWFNIGNPPAYMICNLSAKVYPELDFRPIVKPDKRNCLDDSVQAEIDKIETVKPAQILGKIGCLHTNGFKQINGCIKSLLGL